MPRLCSITVYIGCLCCLMFVSNTYGQDAFLDSMRGTMSGEVIEITEQKPIEGVSVKIVNAADGHEYIVTTDKEGRYEQTGLPAGRYTISVSKNGYGDRIGKSKVVVPGGEVFDRIKMRKKENI